MTDDRSIPPGANDFGSHSTDSLNQFEADAQDRHDHPDAAMRAEHAAINARFDGDNTTPQHVREQVRAAQVAGVTADSVKQYANELIQAIRAERARRTAP